MLSKRLGKVENGPAGRFIPFTSSSQKHRRQSLSKLRLAAETKFLGNFVGIVFKSGMIVTKICLRRKLVVIKSNQEDQHTMWYQSLLLT